MTKAIEDVVKSDLCTGCGLCAGMFFSPAARMEIDAKGYARPQQTRQLTVEESGDFANSCPGIRLEHTVRDETFLPLWGPVKRSQTGFAVEQDIRYKGSSGGGLSALAIYLLESGKVDGVLHIAPSDTEAFANIAQISRTRADVLRGAGSRYAPASPLVALENCLQEPGVFAFIGKPCDVAALRAISRRRATVAEKFPILMSFMCAGTPGFKGTEAVVRAMGLEPEKTIRFRYRGNGWPGKARAETAEGKVGEMDYDSSWGNILNRHLQFRCKICPDGTGEFADVTCADAWYGNDKGYPTFEESDGRSLVLSRSTKGMQLVNDAVEAGYLAVADLPIEDIERMQPYQADRKRMVAARLFGRKLALRKIPKYIQMGLLKLSLNSSKKRLLRNSIGTWLRSLNDK
ncbi:Coenzyme F420 hydrogenase/dehydrogenase, beta subunit C-terminal domain [Dechloromonas denitrificans]|uniref:Coenzyme F420 hydrogenase/dehydrogenase, beta subunit C-terminal domain n=1 Tax=Dechloromonas denitrificans TaxID=281362 RepID=UPI000AA3F621|nr:Coenzyme F420 hydrogenase/dehydrogenase, beta subunit C-terminal domain [Dechloromonas denitrificans]